MDAILERLRAYGENKLVLAVAAALLGAVLTKLLPALWKTFVGAVMWLARRVSRHAAHAEFRGKYLDWVVTEQRELKLTGIVATDDAKKPTLEQVFVSLSVGWRREEVRDGNDLELLRGIDTRESLAELLDMHRRELDADNLRKLRSSLARAKPPSWWTGGELVNDDTAIQDWVRAHAGSFDPGIVAEYRLRNLVRQPRAAILGGPGAGKSTLLQYLALTFARERAGDRGLRHRGIVRQRLGKQTWRLPIVLRLSSVAHLLARAEVGRTTTLIDVVVRLLPPDLQTDAAPAFFTRELQRGGCLVLLDGLDEVPGEDEFRKVVEAILSMTVAYRENQFLVTSRMAGWRTGLGESFGVSYVNDLTERQIETFVDVWYAAVERNAVAGPLRREAAAERRARERRAKQRARELKQSLRENAGLRRLAVNPMLLSIIALVHRSLPQLPRDRGKLYAECSRLLLEQWDVSKGVRIDDTHLKLGQKEAIMRRLAIALHRGEIGVAEGSREAPLEDVVRIAGEVLPGLGRAADEAGHLLRRLLERSGIIVERQRGVVAFGHHTFQEYFAAQWLAQSDGAESCAFLTGERRLRSDWWREVILLYAGQIGDCSELVGAVYEPRERNLFLPRLRLAVQCVSECVGMSDALLRQAVWEAVLAVRLRGESAHFTVLKPEIAVYLAAWSRGESWNAHAAVTYCRRFQDDREVIEPQLRAALKSTDEEIIDAALSCLPYVGDETIVALRDVLQPHAARLHGYARKDAEVALYAAIVRHEGTVANLSLLLNAAREGDAEVAIPHLRRMLLEEQLPSLLLWHALDWLIDATAQEPAAMELLRESFARPALREEILRVLAEPTARRCVVLAHLAPERFQDALSEHDGVAAEMTAAFGHDLPAWQELIATGAAGIDILFGRIFAAVQASPNEDTPIFLRLLARGRRQPSPDVARAILRLAANEDESIAANATDALPLLLGTADEEAAGDTLVRLCRHRSSLVRVIAIQTTVTFVEKAPDSPLASCVFEALRSRDARDRTAATVAIAQSSTAVQHRYYSKLVEGVRLRLRSTSRSRRWANALEIAYALHAIAAVAETEIERLFRDAVASFGIIAEGEFIRHELADSDEITAIDHLRLSSFTIGHIGINASIRLADRLPPHLALSILQAARDAPDSSFRYIASEVIGSILVRMESAEAVAAFLRNDLASFGHESALLSPLFQSGIASKAPLVSEFLLRLGNSSPASRDRTWRYLVEHTPEAFGIHRQRPDARR